LVLNVVHPQFGAKGDGRSVIDGAMTTGSPILTSGTARFKSADVGKIIHVTGAGAVGAVLTTTILAYVNATTITLAANASTTVSTKMVIYGTDDTAAIQAAIDTAFTTGPKTVFLPRGIFLLSSVPTGGYYLLKIKSGVSVVGTGPGSMLLVGSGLRNTSTGIAVLYNHTEQLSDIVFRDFCIDFNGQNNLFITGYSPTAGVNRTGGGAGCTDIVVENLLLRNSAGYHFLFFDGIGGTNVKIRNVKCEECGQSIAGNQIPDHSSIYCTSDRSEITSSTFSNSSPCNISTAIETHGSDEKIHNNQIRNYSSGYNVCFQVQTNREIDFCDNTLRNIRNGVVIWGSGSFGLSRVRIRKNVIGVRETTRGYPPGIGIVCSARSNESTQNVSHLAIQDNNIFGESTALLTVRTVGIQLLRCDDILISGNNIYDMVGEAIWLESESAPRSIRGVHILHNQIQDVGLTSSIANKRAIALNSINAPGQTISNVDIRGNKITLGAPTGTVASFGIQFNAGSFPDTRIVANTITGFARSPITKGATISTDLFLVEGEGAIAPGDNIRASLGSQWLNTAVTPKRGYLATKSACVGNSDVWSSVEYGPAAPTSGKHSVGDIVFNTAPGLAGPVGWVCTADGTPGIWMPF
jgi:hypothetical protein